MLRNETNTVWVKIDMSENKRNKVKEVREEAKAKNEMRTPEPVRKFTWRVVNMQMRKWWLKVTTEETTENH